LVLVFRADQVPSIVVDNVDPATKITQHFHKNGFSRIAYIAGPDHLSISQERTQGYLSGLKSCNLEFRPEFLVKCNLSSKEATRATAKLLSLPEKPDAIFGINDTVAFAAMKEIKRQGLRIPEDIALVGFTDEFHSTVVEPPLTSVTHPTFEIGQEAAKLFFERIENPDGLPQQKIMKTKLVVRESSTK